MPSLCRDCLHRFDVPPDAPPHAPPPRRCPACGGPRLIAHPDLADLAIAHVDCDAFYASVEKRDAPHLRDRPVIVGGGRRGVVSAACYIARIHGVRSAMPMFKALALCPEAVVIRPRHGHYTEVSRQIRALMEVLTPAVEPLSLDEAFLDLSGTARLHGAPPAVLLADLIRRIEREVGVTASVGLSHNKFLAKIASDLDKPRGFSVIGRAETAAFLAARPVSVIWGVGDATRAALQDAGIRSIADLLRWEEAALTARFGSMGGRLFRLARGQDARRVSADAPVKSISNEVTFGEDLSDADVLEGHLWRLAEKVADRAKAKGLAGRVVTLKLKRADFRLLTRRQSLREPTQLAETLWRAARPLLAAELAPAAGARGQAGNPTAGQGVAARSSDGSGGRTPAGQPPPGREGRAAPGAGRRPPAWRLIGIGLSELGPATAADRTGDLLDPDAARRAAAERATDAIRARFGPDAILRGRGLR